MNIEKASKKHLSMIEDFALACMSDSTANYGRAVKDPEEYLDFIIDRSTWPGESESGLLPCATYFAVQDSRIVAAIRIRSGRNQAADEIHGYIGYETRPSERNKGIAKYLLKWVTENILENETLVAVEESNIRSQKVLASVNAKYVKSATDPLEKITMVFYEVAPNRPHT